MKNTRFSAFSDAAARAAILKLAAERRRERHEGAMSF